MNYKVDLHTHSTVSPDGGITAGQYAQVLSSGTLDYIAVTDHNRIDFALELQQHLGEKIIVGEEIMTTAGEICGLYLTKVVQPHLPPEQAMREIKDQGGLVYIPHPFETVRKGLHPQVLEELEDLVDIIEVCNGRAFFQNRSAQAVVWSRLNHVAACASSDAHGIKGLGRTFTSFNEAPTRENIVELLAKAALLTDRPKFSSLLYPKYHRIRKKLGRK